MEEKVLGKMPPGKLPLENKPPGKLSPGKLPLRKTVPRKIAPLPLKKYSVKLLHVMEEYLSGENFVNFNFRGL